jgi:hypothetical protein
MSGSVLIFYLLLIAGLAFRLVSRQRRKTWESRNAASVEDAIARIKQYYPEAVPGPWQPDAGGWLPADEAMSIWENQQARERGSPPIATIRRYTP